MVTSEWNMALDTLYRLSQGLHTCNDARRRGDFLEYLKGLYHLYMELCAWMSAEDQAKILERFEQLKQYRTKDFTTNLQEFTLCEQILRREADKHKLLLKEAEDTSKHGG